MSLTINVNGLSLCHKGSGGVSMATIPDVCKTPSPGGPVPIPYPNIAKSSDLAKGTTTVSADGGQMCAKYGSEFSLSVGDEPGTAGGVKSSTFKKEASWITHSFDVKLEGKGACRLTDKMFHNHQNTVDMAGLFQRFLAALGGNVAAACAKLWERIEDLIGKGRTGKKDGIRGLEERIRQNKTGPMKPTDPPDRGPNPQQHKYKNGSNGWQRHEAEIDSQQKQLEDALDEFEQNCGGPTPQTKEARKWTDPSLNPTPADYASPVPAPAPAPAPSTSSSGPSAGTIAVIGAIGLVTVGLIFALPTGGGSLVAGGAAAAVVLGVGLGSSGSSASGSGGGA
jgi:hypothetical protein